MNLVFGSSDLQRSMPWRGATMFSQQLESLKYFKHWEKSSVGIFDHLTILEMLIIHRFPSRHTQIYGLSYFDRAIKDGDIELADQLFEFLRFNKAWKGLSPQSKRNQYALHPETQKKLFNGTIKKVHFLPTQTQ